MYAKLLTIILGLVVIGSVMLGLRRQGLQMRYEMTRVHSRINDSRKQVWASQVSIAEKTTPQALREAAAEAGLRLEPISEIDIARPSTWPGFGGQMVQLRSNRVE